MNKHHVCIYGFLIAGGMISQLLAAAEQSQPNFQFEVAKAGDDLSRYRDLLVFGYSRMVQIGKQKALLKSIGINFPIICSWIGQESKRFIKINEDGEPIGFFTFEALDPDATEIAVHMSPVLNKLAYNQVIPQIKKAYPQATKVSTAAPEELVYIHAIIKNFGFKKDPKYKVNEELDLDYLGKMIGYSKDI